MAKHSTDFLTWARRGAEARWNELQSELASLARAFPDLATRRGRKRTTSTAAATDSAPRRRKRSKMTAAQRKAVGERMKKYWAARRKQVAKK
jgi:hypothetical protein